MKDYMKLTELMERIIHKYNQAEKKKRKYGTDELLSRTEIHIIAVVGDNAGINVTSLAKNRGVTKGAASQMVYKLVDKGFIEKRVSENSDTEVSLFLTEKGKEAYNSHKEYHDNTNEEFFNLLRNMPEDVEKELTYILEKFDDALDKRLK